MDAGHTTIVAKAAFRVCGISCRTCNARPHEIAALWGRYFHEGIRERIHDRTQEAIIAVYSEYESDYNGAYTLLIGNEVGAGIEAPHGLVAMNIPAATYRVMEARGEQPAATIAAWQQVWSSDLPRTYTADFDLHQPPDTVWLHVAVRDPARAC